MRISTGRVKQIDAFYREKDAKEYADVMSNIASDYSEDLAADLLEAREELEVLREFKRLVEYAIRSQPTMWLGTFPVVKDELKKKMEETE